VPTATIESSGRLAGTHPAREAFADCSGIYDRVTEGVHTFDDILQGWGYHLDREGMMDLHPIPGGARILVYDDSGRKFGCAYFEWRWIGDGWEVLGRIGKHVVYPPQIIRPVSI